MEHPPFLKKIHSWPDEVRVLLAGVIMAAFAFFLLVSWNTRVSSNLATLTIGSNVAGVGLANQQPQSTADQQTQSDGYNVPAPAVPTTQDQPQALSVPTPAQGLSDAVDGWLGSIDTGAISTASHQFFADVGNGVGAFRDYVQNIATHL